MGYLPALAGSRSTPIVQVRQAVLLRRGQLPAGRPLPRPCTGPGARHTPSGTGGDVVQIAASARRQRANQAFTTPSAGLLRMEVAMFGKAVKGISESVCQ